MLRAIKRRSAVLLAALVLGGCLSPDLTVKTSGEFKGSYASFDGTYSGSLQFDFEQENEAFEAEGMLVINGDVIEFEGQGTLTSNPAVLDLDVTGTNFTMHIEGELKESHLTGSYTFNSARWGNDSGSVDLDLS
ncbi:hypothetical protein CEE36_04030 [candidate division TA06 bacterium B3_TA06]|uniref:Lipid/polyisoprenoid-binding YceI-like domain-containing protein n=1 Tax=candidate division TA06 bacterium B3_TA06 TaxID=2012487 RepID=A0A532V8I2_UNCT6|nr:MAG: hypothetical protein CEE36_04030 [candidate division TA06 bacterium B3_TA06]